MAGGFSQNFDSLCFLSTGFLCAFFSDAPAGTQNMRDGGLRKFPVLETSAGRREILPDFACFMAIYIYKKQKNY